MVEMMVPRRMADSSEYRVPKKSGMVRLCMCCVIRLVRLPQTEVGKFIDLEDSIYAYNAEVLFSKRATVEVNDDVPTYTRKSSSRSRSKKARSSRGRSVTVKSGQTLSEIARRNGTTVAKLKRLNGIKGSNIRAGKKLRVRRGLN